MKTIDKIPTGKIGRTGKILGTGLKVGGNFLKYYSKKAVNSEFSKEELHQENAEDIYNGLKRLKGSALKLAQMLSMEKNLLPAAYVDKFSLAQFSVPPLSAPLVRKTFKRYQGAYPEELFDSFTKESVNAASIGQVHKATKDGKELAVKIQYPGVAESIRSDLALVKPIALKMFNLQAKDSERFFKEVEGKLLEETDYRLEVRQSKEISAACNSLPNLRFPKYYEDLSSERIIVMDWMQGQHLSDFVKVNEHQKTADHIGQILWDFYMFQIHGLKVVHADPHPGNFLIDENDKLIAIDFGCVKRLPVEFYEPYFDLTKKENFEDPVVLEKRLYDLEILTKGDSPTEVEYFTQLYFQMLSLFSRPLNTEKFDFSNNEFLFEITALSDRYSKDPTLRKLNTNRGSEHFIYISRTFMGLYTLLHSLGATVNINSYRQYL